VSYHGRAGRWQCFGIFVNTKQKLGIFAQEAPCAKAAAHEQPEIYF
jgi:hypothetical protein